VAFERYGVKQATKPPASKDRYRFRVWNIGSFTMERRECSRRAEVEVRVRRLGEYFKCG